MADRKQPPKGPKDPKHGPDQGEPDHEKKRPKSGGREHEVHKEILERRMRGGPEPTPDAYTRALEQWKNLPGSIVRPPTDVTPPPEEPAEPSEPADQGGSSSSKSDADKKNNKEN